MNPDTVLGFCDGWSRINHTTEDELVHVGNPEFDSEVLGLCSTCLSNYNKDYPAKGLESNEK